MNIEQKEKMKTIDIFGTLGPSCDNESILAKMFAAGMTGIRINLSHIMLKDCEESIGRMIRAANTNGIQPKILIDMQGPELRIGRFNYEYELRSGDEVFFGEGGIPVEMAIIRQLVVDDEILLDDGKLLCKVREKGASSVRLEVIRGGLLTQRKSIAIVGKSIELPALTNDDRENLRIARSLGITGIMQPFVRCRKDLELLHDALEECGCADLKIYAKIENTEGMKNLESFMGLCDEVIIARGDLGNSMPLWKLPRAQKMIAEICRRNDKPFMVVTQMLASMEKSEVPTRAEVCDIYNAVLDGASSVMVTGETAVGIAPVEVIRYLYNTAVEAVKYNVY